MKLAKTMTGAALLLDAINTTGFPQAPDNSAITVSITGVEGTGRSIDEIWYVQMDEPIAAPKGACVIYTIGDVIKDACDTSEESCPTVVVNELTDDIRIPVLDDKGCPTKHITLTQLLAYVTANQVPVPLCDRLTGQPETLAANMRILALGDDCALYSLPGSAVSCTMADPEAFNCG